MSLGIAVVAFFPQLPDLNVTLFAALIGLLFACGAAGYSTGRHLWVPGLFIIGVLWGTYQGAAVVKSQLPIDFENREVWVRGKVVALPESRQLRGQQVQRFNLELTDDICLEQRCSDAVKIVRISWYEGVAVKPGQHWQLLVKGKRPHGMKNPGGFDYQLWLLQRNIGAVAYVRPHPENRLTKETQFSIDRARFQISQFLDEQLNGLQSLPLLKALLVGDKRTIARQQWDLFSATGTTHLMVISGLHVGLVSSLFYLLGRFAALLCWPYCNAERWGASAAVIAAFVYALAAGFSLPTQRALVMVCVVMICIVLRRNVSVASGLTTALLFCLILDPLAVVGASFWLSFGAVAVLLYGAVGRRPSSGNVAVLLKSQLWVFLGLLPLLAVSLGQVSFISPLANIILVPLFSFLVVPLNLLAALVSMSSTESAVYIWQFLDAVIAWALWYLEWLSSSFKGAGFIVSSRPPLTIVLAVCGVLLLLAPRGLPHRFLGLVLFLPLFFYSAPRIAFGDMHLTVLDVGQGLAIAVETRNQTLLYDVGPPLGDEIDAASAVVIPFLNSRNISKVSELVISHGDSDHAGGLNTLLSSLPVQSLWYGEKLALIDQVHVSNRPKSVRYCHADKGWTMDGVYFNFLNADRGDHSSDLARGGNNRSCVLKITAGDATILLPGDIESRVERELLESVGKQLDTDILIVPHHGSNTSSSWPFVKAVSPSYVVYSAGYINRFSHPSEKVRRRYESMGAISFNTSESGAIQFTVKNGQLQRPVQYREVSQRFWH